MASFGKEFVGRQVLDSSGDCLGTLEDLVIDLKNGLVTDLLVILENDIDPEKLPWPTNRGVCRVPSEEVTKISARIHLRR